mmetsp:Transcript_33065/g.65758  ORF Transcript_33065/g.65758 Transcript_33065/m.65758 type:complete len:275 (+) Transcript_33065:2137-2961(+)
MIWMGYLGDGLAALPYTPCFTEEGQRYVLSLNSKAEAGRASRGRHRRVSGRRILTRHHVHGEDERDQTSVVSHQANGQRVQQRASVTERGEHGSVCLSAHQQIQRAALQSRLAVTSQPTEGFVRSNDAPGGPHLSPRHRITLHPESTAAAEPVRRSELRAVVARTRRARTYAIAAAAAADSHGLGAGLRLAGHLSEGEVKYAVLTINNADSDCRQHRHPCFALQDEPDGAALSSLHGGNNRLEGRGACARALEASEGLPNDVGLAVAGGLEPGA